jgi:hypothetical protein
MKKIYLFIILGAIFLLNSCGEKTGNDDPKRIIGNESTLYGGHIYQIIEVDGVEYLCSGDGGICPITKNDDVVKTYQVSTPTYTDTLKELYIVELLK